MLEQSQPERYDPNTVQPGIRDTPLTRAPTEFDNTSMADFRLRERPPTYQSYPNAAVAPAGYHASSAPRFSTNTSGSHPSRGAGSGTVSHLVNTSL